MLAQLSRYYCRLTNVVDLPVKQGELAERSYRNDRDLVSFNLGPDNLTPRGIVPRPNPKPKDEPGSSPGSGSRGNSNNNRHGASRSDSGSDADSEPTEGRQPDELVEPDVDPSDKSQKPKLSFDALYGRGTTVQRRLDEAISGKKPDVRTPSYQANGYSRDMPDKDKEVDDDSDYETAFADPQVGIDRTKPFKETSLQDERKTGDTVLRSAYSKDQGTVIALDSRGQDNDKSANKLRWSELVFQQWEEIAGEKTKDLKYIVRHLITNPDTRAMIAKAHAENGFGGRGEFKSDPNNKAQNDAFYSLLGTDHGRPVVHMLADHHQALEDKRVVQILTWRHMDKIDIQQDEPLMILVLG